MKLSDAKKLAIRKQLRIRFPIREGLEALINEKGLAQVPGFKGVPDFNLEERFAAATTFSIESAGDTKARPRQIGAAELGQEIAALGHAAPSHDHED